MIPTKIVKLPNYKGEIVDTPVALVKKADEVLKMLKAKYFIHTEYKAIAEATGNTEDEIHDFASKYLEMNTIKK